MAAHITGPFKPSSLKKTDLHATVKYSHCRTPVLAPLDFTLEQALKSTELPSASLKLEHVHGYNGVGMTAPNLFYNSAGHAVYFMAGVGVVLDHQDNKQNFFRGHTDDICCLAMHPDRRLVATGQIGRVPCACIWASDTCEEVARLTLPEGSRGVICVAFPPDGERLITVASDNKHTLNVWDRKAGKSLFEAHGQTGTPPQVFGVVWEPSGGHTAFITYGVKHIKEWRGQPGHNDYKSHSLAFGKVSEPFDILSVCYSPDHSVLFAGCPDGQIATFCKGQLESLTPARKDLGTKAVGSKAATRGVRCLTLTEDQTTLLSGGADGRVLHWALSNGRLPSSPPKATPLTSDSTLANVTLEPTAPPPKLRGLDCWKGTILAGTSRGDIWEVPETAPPRVVLSGHASDVYGLAFNPKNPNLYVTAGEKDRVIVWDSTTRRQVASKALEKDSAHCLAWSSDGCHVAVGLKGGGILVLEAEGLGVVCRVQERSHDVEVLCYSPDNRYLFAGAHDCHIDIHDVQNRYHKTARCSGHSATVRHLDCSLDSIVLQSDCSGYELLYWDTRTGRQILGSQQNTEWATWTCVLGFPVMGIWMKDSDGTDINAADRSSAKDLVVTSDDFNNVRLLTYPCVTEHAPAKAYTGHCSHVMNVSFAPDDKTVVSVGGKDRGVFQWRVV